MRFFFLSVFLAAQMFFSYTDARASETNQADPAIGNIGAHMQSLQGEGGGVALSAPGGLGTFIETIVVLALFIIALYALYRFLRRKRDLEGMTGGDAVRILARQGIGGGKAVEVIEVGRRVFVLGVADSAINLIAEITDEEALESLRLDYVRRGSDEGESFMDRLILVLGRSKQKTQGSISQEKLDYLRAQKERLSAYKKRQ